MADAGGGGGAGIVLGLGAESEGAKLGPEGGVPVDDYTASSVGTTRLGASRLSYREERQAPLDWDARVPVRPRCIAALEFMRRALRERCAAGQPLWPTPASTTLGASYAGRESAARVLVISLAADDAGWRMAVRPPALRLGGPPPARRGARRLRTARLGLQHLPAVSQPSRSSSSHSRTR